MFQELPVCVLLLLICIGELLEIRNIHYCYFCCLFECNLHRQLAKPKNLVVLQKLWMVIWVQFVRLTLTLSHEKLKAKFGKFIFFYWKVFFFFYWRRSWSLEIYRLAKFLTLMQTEFFQYLSRLCTYLWGINSLKSNSAVSKSGNLYGVNQNFPLANEFFSL